MLWESAPQAKDFYLRHVCNAKSVSFAIKRSTIRNA